MVKDEILCIPTCLSARLPTINIHFSLGDSIFPALTYWHHINLCKAYIRIEYPKFQRAFSIFHHVGTSVITTVQLTVFNSSGSYNLMSQRRMVTLMNYDCDVFSRTSDDMSCQFVVRIIFTFSKLRYCKLICGCQSSQVCEEFHTGIQNTWWEKTKIQFWEENWSYHVI